MNADLEAVRQALAGRLAAIPELRAVYPHEPRTSTADELPVAWLWRSGVTPTDVEGFGSVSYDFAWRLRVTFALGEDGPTQSLIDTLQVRLITAIRLDGFLDANGPGIVDALTLTSIDEPSLITIGEQPAVMFEALITTTITG